MKKSILLFLAALATLAASAQTKVEIEGIWYNLVSKAKQAEVTYQGDDEDSYQEYSGSITIPATVTYEGVNYSVTSIGNSAFWDCSSLTAINIPESVTSIGGDAFYGCSSLTDINIPKGVTSIEDWTFRGCSSLTVINIPESVTSIGGDAFYGCSSLTTVTIPSDSQLKSIEAGAFDHCSSLVDITIPQSVTSIEFAAFQYCSSLTSITIPMGVRNIGEQTFRYCSNLTSITLPGVTSIGDNAFFYCENLATITLSTWMTNIGESAFCGCRSLSAITIPKGINEIKKYTFYRCSSLTSITIPEGVTKIGDSAFRECSSITSITIPKSISSIGGMYGKTFSDCSGLTDVYCHAENIPTTRTDVFDGSYVEYATLHVPTSALASYKTKAPWSSFGKFETTSIAVSSITLNQSSAILTEEETLTLTVMVTPDDATDKSISWSSSNPSVASVDRGGKVTAIAPGTATITATANDGSGVSASCVVEVKEKLLGKCATPVISYINGEIVLTCSTEGAEIKTNVTTENDNEFTGTRFEFIPTHTFTAYATKEHYENSDVATLTLCWIPCGDTTGTLNIPSKPVLISTQGGTITVSGLAAGTAVAAYSTAGTPLATATATDGTATLATNLEAGSIAIVKIGDYSIKVAIK